MRRAPSVVVAPTTLRKRLPRSRASARNRLAASISSSSWTCAAGRRLYCRDEVGLCTASSEVESLMVLSLLLSPVTGESNRIRRACRRARRALRSRLRSSRDIRCRCWRRCCRANRRRCWRANSSGIPWPSAWCDWSTRLVARWPRCLCKLLCAGWRWRLSMLTAPRRPGLLRQVGDASIKIGFDGDVNFLNVITSSEPKRHHTAQRTACLSSCRQQPPG